MRYSPGDLPRGFRLFHLLDDHPGQVIGGEHAEYGHPGRDAELLEGGTTGQLLGFEFPAGIQQPAVVTEGVIGVSNMIALCDRGEVLQ